MKFKMAPNSLFAILLRSPWWISWSVAGLIALVCGALLPSHIAPYAAVGALPIFGVGCLAAWRQWRAPSSARVQAVLGQAAEMPWRSFADALERAWQAEGYAVRRLTGLQADFHLEKAGQTALVSARRWKAATHGIEPLRDLQAAARAQDVPASTYIAMQGTVSDNARGYAREHGITLMEGEALAALLLKAPRTATAR
ncbi:restriction endonuclease [Acidovorax sp. SUPP3434]|nr:restriction endonuclease [Acidovorax sp. SUPP3434]